MHSEDMPAGIPESNFSNPVPDAFSTAPTARPTQEPPKTTPQTERPAGSNQTTAPSRSSRESEFDTSSVQRAAAKNVFEAKFREPNPKLPFYITLAVLGSFAIGTVVYFWYQLRPPPALVNTNPKPPADEKKPGAIQTQPGDKPAAPVPNSAGTIPGFPASGTSEPVATGGLPSAAPVGPVVPSPAVNTPAKPGAVAPPPTANPSAAQSAAPARNREVAPPRQQGGARTPRAPGDPSKLSVNRGALEVNPKIEAGWLAYNQGDLKAARSHYQDMLRDEPANRDALLGMAAIEVRANRLDQAANYYQNVLQISPRDPYAQAGLLALRAQVSDPVQTESRVKNLLASDPEAQILYFSLGNQYSQQERWPEAQQAYFKAYSAEPENPDFAYNLAVSLDHVRQPKLALEYYRRALSLAQQRSSSFDQTLARSRVQELAK
jgi:Flp pilus assembly protein TadD